MIYDRLFSCQFVGNVAGSVRRSAHCRVVLRWFLYHVFFCRCCMFGNSGTICGHIRAAGRFHIDIGIERSHGASIGAQVSPQVSQAIPVGGYGRVALDGDDWKACSSDTEELPAGTMVKIIDRESVIVKVTKLK